MFPGARLLEGGLDHGPVGHDGGTHIVGAVDERARADVAVAVGGPGVLGQELEVQEVRITD